MPTHVFVSVEHQDVYRDYNNNIAGNIKDVLIYCSGTIRGTTIYTVVIPEDLTFLKDQLGLVYRAWPSGQAGETLILGVFSYVDRPNRTIIVRNNAV